MKLIRPGILLLAVLLLAACAAQTESDRLHEIVDREWHARLREFPLFATSVGVHVNDNRLPEMRLEDLERRDAMWRDLLAELDAIDRARLDAEDQINLDILRAQLENRIAGFEFGAYQIPLNADSGFHTGFARLPQNVPLDTVAAYENYIERLRGFSRYVDEQIALMRIGLERGMTLPRAVLDGIEHSMATHVVDDPVRSVFYAPFESFPASFAPEEREEMRREGVEAIVAGVVPGYRTLLEFMVEEYIPNARTTLGASELPRGREYYAQRLRHFTTLELTADEIHEIGLAEVERILGEMNQVIDAVGFEGSFMEFLDFLRTEPRFYASTPEELVKEAAWIAKRMDGKLPSLFRTLPRLTYTVEPVPADIAPKYTAGRYVGAPIGSDQPGRYWVNTYGLEARPLYNLEAGAHAARVGPRPSLPDRAQPGAGRPAELPPLLLSVRLRRGVGALLRVARHRGRLLHRPVQQLRPPHVRDVARLPPGRRHRRARQGVEPRADDRLPGLAHRAAAARGAHRDRPLHLLARPGRRLQDRRARDPQATASRRGGARRAVRRP